MNKETVIYNNNLEILNNYMKNKRLDYSLQVKVRKQLENCYKASREVKLNI